MLDLFDEVVPSCCLVGKMQTASQRNCPRDATYTLLIFFPGAHIWQHAPHGMQLQEPHKENRNPDFGFSLSKQLWQPTLHTLCAPELLPEKRQQVANWFNPLGEHYCSLWITAGHPGDQEPLQVFLSHILLLELWEKQFSSTLLLLKAMPTRCTPAL